MVRRLGNRDRLAEAVAWPDPNRELKFVVELLGRPETRRTLLGSFALAVRPADRHFGRTDRGSPAVIGDRDIFVIGIEGVVGVPAHPAVAGMMDAGKEVGEAADRRRLVQGTI